MNFWYSIGEFISPYVNETIVAVISGSIVPLATRIYKRRKNKILEKKYPVAGRYITSYEDEIKDEQQMSTAIAELKQKGNKIFGVTHYEEQEWKITGEIANGYVYGLYQAVNTHDKGIGTFILKINHKRHMIGIWSGFDPSILKVTTGKYMFTPMLGSFFIRKTKEEDISAIIQIANSELGRDYITEAQLKEYIDNKKRFIFKVATHQSSGIIGFCFSILLKKDEIENYIKDADVQKLFQFSSQVGLIKTVAIKDSFKGRGVGTSLVEASIGDFVEYHNVQDFCGLGWKNNNGRINIKGVLQHVRFNVVKEIPNYWEKDSIEKKYLCTICGNPCKCSAVIFTRHP